jgi:hypothetical protein
MSAGDVQNQAKNLSSSKPENNKGNFQLLDRKGEPCLLNGRELKFTVVTYPITQNILIGEEFCNTFYKVATDTCAAVTIFKSCIDFVIKQFTQHLIKLWGNNIHNKKENRLDIFHHPVLGYIAKQFVKHCLKIQLEECQTEINPPANWNGYHGEALKGALDYTLVMYKESFDFLKNEPLMVRLWQVIDPALTEMTTAYRNTVIHNASNFIKGWISKKFPEALTSEFQSPSSPTKKKQSAKSSTDQEEKASPLDTLSEQLNQGKVENHLTEDEKTEKLEKVKSTKEEIIYLAATTQEHLERYNGMDKNSQPLKTILAIRNIFMDIKYTKLEHMEPGDWIRLLAIIWEQQQALDARLRPPIQHQMPWTTQNGLSKGVDVLDQLLWENATERGKYLTLEHVTLEHIRQVVGDLKHVPSHPGPYYAKNPGLCQNPELFVEELVKEEATYLMMLMMTEYLKLCLPQNFQNEPLQWLHCAIYPQLYPINHIPEDLKMILTQFRDNFLLQVDVFHEEHCKAFLPAMFSRLWFRKAFGYDEDSPLTTSLPPSIPASIRQVPQDTTVQTPNEAKMARNKKKMGKWKERQNQKKENEKKMQEGRLKKKESLRESAPTSSQQALSGPQEVLTAPMESPVVPTASQTLADVGEAPMDSPVASATSQTPAHVSTTSTVASNGKGTGVQKAAEVTNNSKLSNFLKKVDDAGVPPTQEQQRKLEARRAKRVEKRKRAKANKKSKQTEVRPCLSAEEKAKQQKDREEGQIRKLASMKIMPVFEYNQLGFIRIDKDGLHTFLKAKKFVPYHQMILTKMYEKAQKMIELLEERLKNENGSWTKNSLMKFQDGIKAVKKFQEKFEDAKRFLDFVKDPWEGVFTKKITKDPYICELLWMAILKKDVEDIGSKSSKFNYSMLTNGVVMNFQLVEIPIGEGGKPMKQIPNPTLNAFPTKEKLAAFSHTVAIDPGCSSLVASHARSPLKIDKEKIGFAHTTLGAKEYQERSGINRRRKVDSQFRKQHPEMDKASQSMRKTEHSSRQVSGEAMAWNQAGMMILLNVDRDQTHRRKWDFKIAQMKKQTITQMVQNLLGPGSTRDNTLVGFGDWNGNKKGISIRSGPFPNKAFKKECQKQGFVVSLNEYCTSKMDWKSGESKKDHYLMEKIKQVKRMKDGSTRKVGIHHAVRSSNATFRRMDHRDKNASNNLLLVLNGMVQAKCKGENPYANEARPPHLRRYPKETSVPPKPTTTTTRKRRTTALTTTTTTLVAAATVTRVEKDVLTAVTTKRQKEMEEEEEGKENYGLRGNKKRKKCT